VKNLVYWGKCGENNVYRCIIVEMDEELDLYEIGLHSVKSPNKALHRTA